MHFTHWTKFSSISFFREILRIFFQMGNSVLKNIMTKNLSHMSIWFVRRGNIIHIHVFVLEI